MYVVCFGISIDIWHIWHIWHLAFGVWHLTLALALTYGGGYSTLDEKGFQPENHMDGSCRISYM